MNLRLLSFTRTRGGVLAIWVVVAAVIVAGPWLGIGDYWIRQILLIAMLALVASGLSLSFGYAGELALGQAAMYAAGAYTAGWVAKNLVNDMLVAAIAGAIAALIVGLISGIPGLRLGGWVLAIASFFLVLLIPDVVSLIPTSVLGGFSGLTGVPLPAIFGISLDNNAFYSVAVVIAVAWFAFFRNFIKSRHGSSLLVLRQSPLLASSLGLSVYRIKLQAYAIGAIPAGIAGSLFAYLSGFVAPDSFTLDYALSVLAACILGGATSVYGVIIGAVILQLGPMQSNIFNNFALVAYGALLLLGGIFLRRGIAGLAKRLWNRWKTRRAQRATGAVVRSDFEATGDLEFDLDGLALEVRDVAKSFGGNAALRGVSFRAEAGQITALIGPNGSGKTTLLNTISGYYRVDSGHIVLGEQELTGMRSFRISLLGVSRTFQTPVIPAELSVRDCLMTSRTRVSRMTILGAALRTPGYRRGLRNDEEVVDGLLHSLGLWDRRDEDASSLSVGTRRMVELGRAVASEPSLILLDEVASGLDAEEIIELGHVLERLRAAGATILLVEHNFALVQSIADRIVVLAEGGLLAEGTPQEIETDAAVLEHYLGRGAAVSGTTITKPRSKS